MRLELRGVTKRYGALVANDGIDLTVEPGQIHALLGENGAGKTTLMNVLYGLTQPDEGQILADGQPVTLRSPKDAIKAGFGMVHQHFMLVPVFTVAENVTLGAERTRRLGLLDRRSMRSEVRELSERYGLRVDPDARIEELPVGVQQRVEIIKALVREARVLILDEPTSVLTPGETEELFTIMRQLRADGRSIIFISHKLREVQEIADVITVIRRGQVVGERPPTATDEELAALMVGRQVTLQVSKTPAAPGEVVLQVEDLHVPDDRGQDAVAGVSFEVRAGEILGVAGVQGNGQTELCEALMGLRPRQRGHGAAVGARHHDGHAAPADPRRHRLRARGPPGRRDDRRLLGGRQHGARRVRPAALRPARHRPGPGRDPGQRHRAGGPVRCPDHLGGHAPRARCRAVTSRRSSWPGSSAGSCTCCWPASRPAAWTWARSSSCTSGSSPSATRAWPCVIISAELDEIYALADRIAVMYEGRITGIRPPSVPVEELGMLMAGATVPDDARRQTHDDLA